jgi:ATP-dependent DNA helicase DinG
VASLIPDSVNVTAQPQGTVVQFPTQPLGVERAFEILAQNLPGFEKRPEQYALTVRIATSLASDTHLVAEAPTGTGKSFAAALGIIANYYGTEKKAIIATANNNLLEQYASKDLPFLESLFPGLKWAKAKGKNNYACIDKAEKVFGQQVLFETMEYKGLRNLREWYDSTSTGDKEEIDFSVADKDWQKINADDTCTGRKCPFYEDCHYFKAKKEVARAQIIITNYDLVLLDALNPEIQIFPHYDGLILDEAHQLEEKAISKLERSLTERQVDHCLGRAEKEYKLDDKDVLQSIQYAKIKLFNKYRSILNEGDEKAIIMADDELNMLTADFDRAMSLLRGHVARIKTPPNTRERMAQDNFIELIASLARAAYAAIMKDSLHVSWVEATKRDVKVVTCPFRVGKRLYNALFSDPDKTVVCISATLAAGGQKPQFTATQAGLQPAIMFEQFRQKAGLMMASEFVCPSPFDYKNNCVLYLPKPPNKEVEDPNSEAWREWAKKQTLELVKLSKGRAFVLTTSTKNTVAIGEYLSKYSGFPVRSQSPELPNSKLIEWFKATENSIIVATASFWEGVSIEGDDLKLVIIDRIPFVPHTEPIQKAREEWYKSDEKRKGRAFMDLQVYPAVIRLKQGFGRLIRTKADTGAVAILDPRLTTKGYKNVILNSLPPAARVTDIADERLVRILQGGPQDNLSSRTIRTF